MASAKEFPHVLWLGGGSAAGKTTIARTIAIRFDLRFYRVDSYAYEHRARLIAGGLIEGTDESHDRRWLGSSADELARQFADAAEQLFPLILDDLRSSGPDVAVVVEGPHLFPSLVAPHLAAPDRGLWLLPTERFQRQALRARPGSPTGFTSDPDRALDNLVARNRRLDARTRAEAAARGLTVYEVDGGTGLPAMVTRVSEHFADAISAIPGARSGAERSWMRRLENDAMVRNVRSFLADLGSSAPVGGPPPLGFLCECTRLGCEELVRLPLTEYERHRASDRPITTHVSSG